MKVKLKTLMAGPEGVFRPGSVIDLQTDDADSLVAAGYAAPIEHPVETAAFEPGNREVRPMSRPRKVQGGTQNCIATSD
jgi:hypothetical protein